MRFVRKLVLCFSSGIIWCVSMRLLFVYSGAQTILANPAYQSGKFLRVFTEYEPLPRMAGDPGILWIGFIVCGLPASLAFLLVNAKMSGSWLRRGIVFGLIHFCLMAPGFEFYLPYNVMHEPLELVLFESLLWLITLILLAIYMSFIINFPGWRAGESA
jgi:hypothetical protein